jgi:hypothetical protein
MTRTFGAFGARPGRRALGTLLFVGTASAGIGLLVTACSNSGSSSGGGAPAPRRLAAVPSAQNGASAAHGTVSGEVAKIVRPARSIIYTADLSVRITKGTVTNAANRATTLVTAAGGYVSAQHEIAGRHELRQVDLTLKIPVARYGAVLAQLKGLGRKISFSSHAVDVTQQVADVNSRVASAQAAIKQLRALLSKAGSVGQLLSVQETINRQESNLEALLAQQRALAHETSYATVTAILVAHHKRPVPKPEKTAPGFLAGLKGGWHALVTVVGWLLTALGSALPFLIPIALVAGIALEGRRRLARKKTPPASEPPTPAAS